MPPIFYDTHAHLNYPDFADELPEILTRARIAGITRIVAIATDLESSRRCIELAARHDEVFAAVGWHPSDAETAPEDFEPALLELASHPKVVAIGETGLDHYRLPSKKPGVPASADEPYKQKQEKLFRQHLKVAAKLGLNVVVHQRSCLEPTLAEFEPYASRVRGVFHCFADDPAAMRRIIGMGSLVSFTGIVTFKNGQNIRDTVAETPIDKLMLETDSPFLAPMPHRGKRCEPAYVKEIAETVALVKKCPLEELSAVTCATADTFFGFPCSDVSRKA